MNNPLLKTPASEGPLMTSALTMSKSLSRNRVFSGKLAKGC